MINMGERLKNYLVRPVSRKDSKKIWEIRNHPVTRTYSGNSEAIPFSGHDLWFKNKYFSGSDNRCFILQDNKNTVIGYCRLDYSHNNEAYVISIALDNNYYGKGLGHYLLSNSLAEFSGVKNILAEINKENSASLKLFKKNNFRLYKEDEKKYYLKFKNDNKQVVKK